MKKLRYFLIKEKAFTLIEILIVIVILGILSTIAVPRLTGILGQAEMTEAVAALRALRSAVEVYYLDEEQYPVNVGQFNTIAARYLEGYSSGTPGRWESWDVSFSQQPSSDYSLSIIGADGDNHVFAIEFEDTSAGHKVYLLHDDNGFKIEHNN
ncbi:prepilin-type N-terminal cleavage/methylation domain-containing protein [Natronospora cellulosivora (SeqCode)]